MREVSDQRFAPPSYAELKLKKPMARVPSNPKWEKPKPLPIKIVTCEKCHKAGGTLVNVGTHREPIYKHQGCAV